MGTSAAYGFAFAAVLAAVFGSLFFGGSGLIVAIVLLGLAVMALAAETDARTTPRVTQSPGPFRYACPGCGSDVYAGQPTCPECRSALPAALTPKG